MKRIDFFVPGEPQGKARPRVVGGHAYTPERTARYEIAIRAAYRAASREMFPAGVPLKVVIHAAYTVPKSASNKRRREMLYGVLRPTKRPDCDNIAKAVLDALNGVAYHDDAQIVHLSVIKSYSETPGIKVLILGGIA